VAWCGETARTLSSRPGGGFQTVAKTTADQSMCAAACSASTTGTPRSRSSRAYVGLFAHSACSLRVVGCAVERRDTRATCTFQHASTGVGATALAIQRSLTCEQQGEVAIVLLLRCRRGVHRGARCSMCLRADTSVVRVL
jgi:hypothetical protein